MTTDDDSFRSHEDNQPQHSDFNDEHTNHTDEFNRSSQEQPKEGTQNALSAKETRHVRRVRFIMLTTLTIFAITVSILVYYYTRSVEESEFETDFMSNGNKVVDAFAEDAYRKMQALFSLSSAITSHALFTNSTWPFVTVPNSAEELGPYLSLADAAALTIFPIVPAHLRAEWEIYALEHQHWIDKDLEHSTINTTSSTSTLTTTSSLEQDKDKEYREISPYIKNYVGIDTSPGIWTPWWQYAPVIANRWFVNFNRLAWKGFSEQLQTVVEGKASLSESSTFVPGLDLQSTKDFDFFTQLLQAGGSGRYGAGEPLSYIFYPIFDNFDHSKHQHDDHDHDHDEEEDEDLKDRTVVAILQATVYWQSYFQGILPDDVEGIVCVVTNSAGQAFTYQLHGRDAHFLGMEDLHDPQFDRLKLEADYSAFLMNSGDEINHNDHHHDQQKQQVPYQGVPVDDDYIGYKLQVYPSVTMQNNYYTNNPFYFALAIGLVFVLCAIIFMIYNKFVERRQELVLTTAVKSTAVVESIFPSTVRDRLMDDALLTAAPTVGLMSTGKDTSPQSTFSAREGPRDGRNNGEPNNQQLVGANRYKSAPIADYFEGTTVFFADIMGFTSWCDNREPVQVFTLLESLYGEFDQIAKRRRVYKVETVGDCYMAVTGLPQARRDHALAMARFANDVSLKFNQVIHELEDVLGEGTRNLGLRIGLHSGPVTAGVIRGDNARFQLFGDTVNFASRMESTCEGGRIQISTSTAQLLQDAGKSAWITPRQDMVVIKGKGPCNTFWLNVEGPTRHLDSSESGASGSENGDMVSGSFSFLENVLKKRMEQEVPLFGSDHNEENKAGPQVGQQEMSLAKPRRIPEAPQYDAEVDV